MLIQGCRLGGKADSPKRSMPLARCARAGSRHERKRGSGLKDATARQCHDTLLFFSPLAGRVGAAEGRDGVGGGDTGGVTLDPHPRPLPARGRGAHRSAGCLLRPRRHRRMIARRGVLGVRAARPAPAGHLGAEELRD